MTKKQINDTLGIALVCLCVAGGVWGIVRQRILKNKHSICVARVNNYTADGRGNGGGIWIDYTIVVNGKTYNGSSLYDLSDISSSTVERVVIHRTFPAAYNPGNPRISSLLIMPKDFSRFGFNFPDSLKWVLEYVKK